MKNQKSIKLEPQSQQTKTTIHGGCLKRAYKIAARIIAAAKKAGFTDIFCKEPGSNLRPILLKLGAKEFRGIIIFGEKNSLQKMIPVFERLGANEMSLCIAVHWSCKQDSLYIYDDGPFSVFDSLEALDAGDKAAKGNISHDRRSVPLLPMSLA